MVSVNRNIVRCNKYLVVVTVVVVLSVIVTVISSSSTLFILFLEKKFNRTRSVPL